MISNVTTRIVFVSIFIFPFSFATSAIATPVTVTVGSSSTNTAISNVKAGDTINIEATLFSSDPNENGENEPLVVNSSGGFSTTIGNYGQARAFSFQATIDGESLTTSIPGADGDESAQITIDLNQKKRFTQAQKDALSKASADLNSQAGSEATIAAACLLLPDPSVTKACAVGFGLLSGGTWVLSGELNKLALDPADLNYTVIAVPLTPTPTLLTVQVGIVQSEADSFNALLTNQAQAIGLARAITTSINRAQGAYISGATDWETKQMQAATQFAIQLSALLKLESNLYANINQSLIAAGSSLPQVTYNSAYAFDYLVAYSGLPNFVTQALIQFGADSSAIDTIHQIAFVQDPNAMAGTTTSVLINQNVLAALQNGSDALFAFALDNAPSMTLGQGVEAEGGINSLNGSMITFEFNAQGQKIGSAPKGKLILKDRSSSRSISIRSTSISRAALLGNTAVVEGKFIGEDGSSGAFRIIATDNNLQDDDKKGVADTFSIDLFNGYSQSGSLIQGDVQIHNETDKSSD